MKDIINLVPNLAPVLQAHFRERVFCAFSKYFPVRTQDVIDMLDNHKAFLSGYSALNLLFPPNRSDAPFIPADMDFFFDKEDHTEFVYLITIVRLIFT